MQQGYSPMPSTGSYVAESFVGFLPRLGAYLIDAVILIVASFILGVVHLTALGTLVSIAYFVYFWSTTGQTVGMMALKIRVARIDGQPLSIGTGILRYVGLFISFLVIFLGVLWIIWDPKKQGWHDKIASTVVVPAV